ncbi:heme-degrading monooxygenase HmoA [Sphingomonas jinjuensis]|uniref:Heme-degrading monooxygenase HmoA n=1 Tax=Sphingomonas jinjuensis TaxID=535907 RepID=A0A840F0B4_9SPHN|nr:antibiotic biosynthesis monooxygenase [Sphingomonas jinjuensis]MBB4152713.1 heme-degrading monooxygenase HmoA [Sphingomonas jinjuensis]
MDGDRNDETAVIFTSRLTGTDPAGYAEAASRMETLAAQQPGYRGIQSARGTDGLGITVSYWASEADAVAWRDQPDHAATREAGRARWYAEYQVVVAHVARDYRWTRG